MDPEPEPPPLHARVRWGNVARAVAVLAVAGLVVAWPRLRPPVPDVPDAAAVPVERAPTNPGPTGPGPTDLEPADAGVEGGRPAMGSARAAGSPTGIPAAAADGDGTASASAAGAVDGSPRARRPRAHRRAGRRPSRRPARSTSLPRAAPVPAQAAPPPAPAPTATPQPVGGEFDVE